MAKLGRYQLLEELGSGGFAVVYKAEISGPEGFRSHVAIKRIHPFLTQNDSGFVASLTNEARICAMIQHPNIVHVHELASEPDEEGRLHYYMVMELVNGVTLDILSRMAEKRGELLPKAVAIHVLIQIARGLGHVHTLKDETGLALGMVHRDLKPGNVLISDEGVAKILDFGIAKAINMSGPRTATGVTRGTAAYMSPEQAYGQKVSYSSDLFAFGAILFEVVTGKQLVEGDSMASQLMAVVNMPANYRAAEVREQFPELVNLFKRLRHPDPHKRMESTAALLDELRRIRRGLDDDTDAEEFLCTLMSDPSATVTKDEIAQFKVMRADLRAPSTATFFELPGHRRDRDGNLVPATDAAHSWGIELTPADGVRVEEPPVSQHRRTAVMPAPTIRRRVPLFWLVTLLIMIGVSGFLLYRLWAVSQQEPDAPATTFVPAEEDVATMRNLSEITIEDDGTVTISEPEEQTPEVTPAATPEVGKDDGAEAVAEEATPAPSTPGTLKINAYPAATVYIDGKNVGSTFVTSRGVAVEPGAHQLRLVRTSDEHEQSLSVTIKPGQVLAVPFEWES